MPNENVEVTDEEKAVLEAYNKEQAKGEDDSDNSNRSEQRHQRLANERTDLKEMVSNLQATISQMQADNNEVKQKELINKGDFKTVITGKDSQIADLEARLLTSNADLMRFKIGIKEGLPPAIAEILRGTDEDSITAHANRLKGELPKFSSYSDGRQTSDAPTISKGNGSNPQDKYQEVRVDNIV